MRGLGTISLCCNGVSEKVVSGEEEESWRHRHHRRLHGIGRRRHA